MIPLALRIRKETHRSIAIAQDLIVEELYKCFNEAVLHGGTAIWRCYQGNRFSEDVDVYIPRDEKRLANFFESLKKQGFIVIRKKISETSLFSLLQLNRTEVRFEALFKLTKGSLQNYEIADGNLITVYTLLPEELIKEKISAYLKRKKIRDLYDIFFLLKLADKKIIAKELKDFIARFEPPDDEKDLKTLIIQGLVPDVKGMIDYIERCCHGQGQA